MVSPRVLSTVQVRATACRNTVGSRLTKADIMVKKAAALVYLKQRKHTL
jgi:hypothetical protein